MYTFMQCIVIWYSYWYEGSSIRYANAKSRAVPREKGFQNFRGSSSFAPQPLQIGYPRDSAGSTRPRTKNEHILTDTHLTHNTSLQ
jgi:hypothetical protein